MFFPPATYIKEYFSVPGSCILNYFFLLVPISGIASLILVCILMITLFLLVPDIKDYLFPPGLYIKDYFFATGH